MYFIFHGLLYKFTEFTCSASKLAHYQSLTIELAKS